MFSTSKCGIRTLRVTLRSVHPLLACPPPHFSSPYSTPLPPRLSPDSTRTANRRTCRRPHLISPPTACPRRFGCCDLHLAHFLQPLVAGPPGQSVPICAPRVPVSSLPARAPLPHAACLSASTYLPVPCGLTRHRRRQNAPELADGPPLPSLPRRSLVGGRRCRRRLCRADDGMRRRARGRAVARHAGGGQEGVWPPASGAPRDRGGQDDRARRGRAVACLGRAVACRGRAVACCGRAVGSRWAGRHAARQARRRRCRRRLCYDRPAAANGTHQYCYVRNLLHLRRCSVLAGATYGSGVRRARKVA